MSTAADTPATDPQREDSDLGQAADCDHKYTIGDWARRYAVNGWAVVPLHTPTGDGSCSCGKPGCASPGKHPRTVHGLDDATTDLDQIAAWWSQWPDANIGAPVPAGHLVADVDVDHGGTLDQLGTMPTTVRARSGSGGWHIWTTVANDEELTGKFRGLTGIDVRKFRNYMVLPPSLHKSGNTYQWEIAPFGETPIAPAPEHLLARVRKPPRVPLKVNRRPVDAEPDKACDHFLQMALDKVDAGDSRHETMKWLSQQLVDNRVEQEDALAVARDYANAVYDAGPNIYDEAEAESQMEWAYANMTPRDPTPFHREPQQQEVTGAVDPNADGGEVPDTVLTAAEAFARAHSGRLVNVVGWGWLYYDGQGWARTTAVSGVNPLYRMYADWVAGMSRPLADIPLTKKQEFDALLRGVRTLRNKSAEVLDVAAQFVQRLPGEFDRDRHLLGTPNGVVDLRTGTVLPSRAEDHISRRTTVRYNPAARSVRFEQFLRDVFQGDGELIRYAQKALGYALTGEIDTHVFHILWGAGRNGKGTLVDAVAHAMGTYSWKASSSSFLTHKDNQRPTNDLADMDGVRLVYAEEPDKKSKLDMGRVKELTGGSAVNARRLYKEAYNYNPTAKYFLLVNPLPTVHDSSDGAWARLRLVPFRVSFLGREDFDLPKLLAQPEHAEAILAWLVEGAIAYYREKLPACEQVLLAGQSYEEHDDPARAYFTQRVVKDSAAQVELPTLYRAYTHFLDEDERLERLSNRAFAQMVASLGYRIKRTNGKRRVLGARVLVEGETQPQSPQTSAASAATEGQNDNFPSVALRRDFPGSTPLSGTCGTAIAPTTVTVDLVPPGDGEGDASDDDPDEREDEEAAPAPQPRCSHRYVGERADGSYACIICGTDYPNLAAVPAASTTVPGFSRTTGITLGKAA